MCTNCSSEPATPAQILEGLGLTKQDLADDPLLVLDFLKVYDAIDQVSSTDDQWGRPERERKSTLIMVFDSLQHHMDNSKSNLFKTGLTLQDLIRVSFGVPVLEKQTNPEFLSGSTLDTFSCKTKG
ncbi:hypothetical protein TNCV_828441 [Trichonephila clavipes]|nr:hypothetical protein TNCV_828441 [Trichonephila clavipes]